MVYLFNILLYTFLTLMFYFVFLFLFYIYMSAIEITNNQLKQSLGLKLNKQQIGERNLGVPRKTKRIINTEKLSISNV